jgi:hypothetical protein
MEGQLFRLHVLLDFYLMLHLFFDFQICVWMYEYWMLEKFIIADCERKDWWNEYKLAAAA